MKRPARLCIMVSGAGRTLANLLERTRNGDIHATIELVIASRECPGARIARQAGVPVLVIPGEIPPERLGAALHSHRIDAVALAGYLRLIRIPPAYRGRIVNIHPALLPDFGGAGMYGAGVHRAVLDSGAPRSGCTVHLVDDEYDRGRILLTSECPVHEGDTPETLAARVFDLEVRAYPEALRRWLAELPDPPVADHPADPAV